MSSPKLTLQNRITTLIIILSILAIAAFTFIQLDNQLANLNRYNTYQASLSSLIVKNNLEAISRHIDQAQIADSMQSSLIKMRESKVIKEAVVFNREGKIIASTEASLRDQVVRYKDLGKFEALEYALKDKRWFLSEIDKADRRLNTYLALSSPSDAAINYVARVSFSLGNIQEALVLVYKPVIITAVILILFNILLGYFLSRAVIGPIKLMNSVTKIIAGGNLSVRTKIHTNDELQELGETFNYMTEELVKMKEKAENANPLTKLPGNIVIREEVEERLKQNRRFAVIYCDLDNFKAFNDKYGIAKGDEAIKLTAEIFKAIIKTKGNADDFLGHEGGDDFILLTTPDKAEEIANSIIREFDRRIRDLYCPEDLKQNCIIAHARDGSIKQFPIMSISLSGVTNEHRDICGYAEVTNIAAEVKKKAKAIEGSVFVMDKRRDYLGLKRENRPGPAQD